MATTTRRPAVKQLSNRQLVERLHAVMLNAAKRQRSVSDDRQYPVLRREMSRRKMPLPQLVQTHPTIDSFMAEPMRSGARLELVERVQEEFSALLNPAEDTLVPPIDGRFDAGVWTGIQSRQARLSVVRELIPFAQASVEGLIDALSEPGGNGGPILDERAEAIEALRNLHRALGDILMAVDRGQFDDDLGQGLPAEAVRWAKRAIGAIKEDRMAFIASGLLFGIFQACGFPDVADYAAGLAASFRRRGRD